MCPVETVSKNSFSTLRRPKEGVRRRGVLSLRGVPLRTRGDRPWLEPCESSRGLVIGGGFGTPRGVVGALRGEDSVWVLLNAAAFLMEFRSV